MKSCDKDGQQCESIYERGRVMGQKELKKEYHDVNASSRHYEYNNNKEKESISWKKSMIWYET